MRSAWWMGPTLVALAAGGAFADEWSHEYKVSGVPTVRVSTDDGSVRVEPGDDGRVEARVTSEGWRIGPGEVTISEHQDGNRVELEVRVPKQLFQFGIGSRSLAVVLHVPARSDLDVKTGDGRIEAHSVSGSLSLSSGDGSITARDLQGELRLHTGDGSIRGSGLSGSLRADTGDGHVDVRGRFEALELRTGDGGIEATAEAGSKLASAWSIETGDGSISLRLPEGLGAELDASTGDGRITLDRPVSVAGKVERRSVRGTLGPGGPPLRVHSGDGSIRLSGPLMP